MTLGLRCFACGKWFGRHWKHCGMIQARQKMLAQMEAAKKRAIHPVVPYKASIEQDELQGRQKAESRTDPPRHPYPLHPSTVAAAKAADDLRRKREELASRSEAERIVSDVPTNASDPVQFIQDIADWERQLASISTPAEKTFSFAGGDSGGGGASDSWSGGSDSSSSCDSTSSDSGGSCDTGGGGSE